MDDENATAGQPPAIQDRQLVPLRIIWAALVAGPAIFCGVVVLLRAQGSQQPFDPAAAQVLFVIAVAFALAGSFASTAAVVPLLKGKPPPPGVLRAQTATILSMALCEGPALLVLVAYLLTGKAMVLVALLACAAAMMTHYPSREHVEELERRFAPEG